MYRRPYTVRQRQDPIEFYSNKKFFQRFRLSKPAVGYVVTLIDDQIRPSSDQNAGPEFSTAPRLLSSFFLSKGEDGTQETAMVTMLQFMGVQSDHPHKTAISAQPSCVAQLSYHCFLEAVHMRGSGICSHRHVMSIA